MNELIRRPPRSISQAKVQESQGLHSFKCPVRKAVNGDTRHEGAQMAEINDDVDNKRNQGKHCHFHKDRGHDTKEYMELNEEIEHLLRQGS